MVEDGIKILSHSLASSADLQVKYGGVVPEVAARRQVETIIPVVTETIQPFNHSTIPNIDAIAVTIGPGLIGSLLVGVETAKTLSYVWQKPLVPVNHLIGHIYSAWLNKGIRKQVIVNSKKSVSPQTNASSRMPSPSPNFPALALIVSGGHSELILMQNHGNFEKIGQTLDDAAGEAFDKVAQLLDLPYPGGPEIEKLAQKGNPTTIKLPLPMIDSGDFNFSFSGLKTAARQHLTSEVRYPHNKADLAASFQRAVIDVLVSKTLRAAEEYDVKSVLLTGGVAANQPLRKALQEKVDQIVNIDFFCPPISLATDNANYIATAAYFNYNQWVLKPNKSKSFSLTPNPNLKIN